MRDKAKEMYEIGELIIDAITIELRKLKEVNGALVLENIGGEVDENGVDPGNIEVFKDGIATENIARTLYKFGDFGIKTQVNITYKIENSGGQIIDVNYNMFNSVPIYVKVMLLNSAKNSTDLKDKLPDLIKTSRILKRIKDAGIRLVTSHKYQYKSTTHTQILQQSPLSIHKM